MSFDPKQKGYRIGAEEAGTLVSPESYEPLAFESRFARNGRGAPDELVPPLKAQSGQTGKGDGAPLVMQPEVADTLTAPKPDHELRDGKRQDGGRIDKIPLVVPALTTRCGNTQDDQQTGQIVAVPISGDAMRGEGEAQTPSPDAEGRVRLRDPGLGVGEPGDPAFTLAAAGPGAVAAPGSQALAYGDANRNGWGVTDEEAPTLPAETPRIAVFTNDEVAAPLSHGSHPNSNMAGRRREDDENLAVTIGSTMSANDRAHVDETPPLKVGTGIGVPSPPAVAQPGAQPGASVRRLTPRECERLQALPDDWTKLDEKTPDSRRYAGLGDAVTASVAEWIGRRIAEAEGYNHKEGA